MFSNASNLVKGVDTAFVVIFSVIFFFLIGLTATLIYFIYRYNEKRNPKATQIEGNNTLEIIWTVIPLLLVLGMFYFGWTGWKPLYSPPPKDSMKIKTIARMWKWSFEYENGKRMDTLYVPQGEPVTLDLVSMDVIHSLYIPAFRLKQDIVPGKKMEKWFIGNTPGDYDLFCSEYCGLNHSYMYTSVKVLPQKEFKKWYVDTTTTAPIIAATPAMAGKLVIQKYGCNACHSSDGSKIIGPSYKGIFGKEVVVITNGKERTVTVDGAYIKHSVYDPNADVVKGFNKGLMQPYKGQVNEEELNQIIEYIKSLK